MITGTAYKISNGDSASTDFIPSIDDIYIVKATLHNGQQKIKKIILRQ